MTIEEMLKETPDLPTMPAAALSVIRETDSATGTAHSVAGHISHDQALAARVLRLANSAYYGLQRQVADLQEAVVVLGMRSARNLAVLASTQPLMSKAVDGCPLDPQKIWKHSFAVAVAAQQAANVAGASAGETAFVAGLLHNVGRAALNIWLGARIQPIAEAAVKQGVSMVTLEQTLLGFDHAEIGAYLGEQWNLPEVLTTAIRFHHNPMGSTCNSKVAECVHLGDWVAYRAGIRADADDVALDFQEGVLDRLRLDSEAMTSLETTFPEAFEKYEALLAA